MQRCPSSLRYFSISFLLGNLFSNRQNNGKECSFLTSCILKEKSHLYVALRGSNCSQESAATKGGQLRSNIWNSKEKPVQFTPSPTLVIVAGAEGLSTLL